MQYVLKSSKKKKKADEQNTKSRRMVCRGSWSRPDGTTFTWVLWASVRSVPGFSYQGSHTSAVGLSIPRTLQGYRSGTGFTGAEGLRRAPSPRRFKSLLQSQEPGNFSRCRRNPRSHCHKPKVVGARAGQGRVREWPALSSAGQRTPLGEWEAGRGAGSRGHRGHRGHRGPGGARGARRGAGGPGGERGGRRGAGLARLPGTPPRARLRLCRAPRGEAAERPLSALRRLGAARPLDPAAQHALHPAPRRTSKCARPSGSEGGRGELGP